MGYTSSKVKNRYNKKVYKAVSTQLKKELVEQWEIALKEDKISKADFIRQAINDYLKSRGN